MYVTKRDGRKEEVNLEKITQSVSRVCQGFEGIDFYSIAIKTINGLYDGVSTKELDQLSIQTAVGLIADDPIYSKVAARLMSNFMSKEVENSEIYSFSQSVKEGFDNGLISEEIYNFVMAHKRKLNNAIVQPRDDLFEYYGLRIVYDRYLLKHPHTRLIIENPQYWFLRVACGLSDDVKEVINFYNMISQHEYMPSTPTLFNSGTNHPQMSSCYLLDSPMDDLRDIEKRRMDCALLSKWAGGIGLSYSRVRGNGALIKGTNGKSNGIIPFIHSLDANVAAVNQGGKRKGAACVYLETHHPDIMSFLSLRDNTGDPEKRSYNLNIANWIPDLFMERVNENGVWSLFDPSIAPELVDLFGDEYKERYLELEEAGKFKEQVPARKIYRKMMQTIAETGNGWMTWKDTSNVRCNSAVNGSVVHSSNLCTEIIEPTSSGFYNKHNYKDIKKTDHNINVIGIEHETGTLKTIDDAEVAVCNLGSINLAKYVKDDKKIDRAKLRRNVQHAVKFLDRVIDRNFYPIDEAKASNGRLRPVGLGLMGWQDMLFKLDLPFEDDESVNIAREISEDVYYYALKTSNDLAKEFGPHRDFEFTHAANGLLQFDLAAKMEGYTEKYNDSGDLVGYVKEQTVNDEVFEVSYPHQPKDFKRWNELKDDIKKYGLRNSLLIAIAPTATISAIVGSYECIEPQVSNIFKRETLSGEFITTNKYLVEDLKTLGLWNKDIMNRIIRNDGSVQNITELPEHYRNKYKTVWEIKQKCIIDQAAARGVYIDQAQSTNLFMADPTIDKLSSMYMYAWRNRLKTTYYLRSKPATKILNTGDRNDKTETNRPLMDLENPESCESCT